MTIKPKHARDMTEIEWKEALRALDREGAAEVERRDWRRFMADQKRRDALSKSNGASHG